MPSSSVFKQIEDLLEEVLWTLRKEYEGPYPVLCETDRNNFVKEEEILRKELKEMEESDPNTGNCQWWSWVSQPSSSPQAEKCLKGAEELLRRVKDDINEKVRGRLSGRSNLPFAASYGQGSALIDARMPETDTGRPPADANPQPASTVITSPLNMSCSPSEASELIVYPTVQNDNDYASDLSDAINSPLEISSDRSSDSSSRRQRCPAPPPPRRIARSSNSHLLSENTSDSGSGSPRRSGSVRRPAPPPPVLTRRARTPGSSISGSLLSPTPVSPNPAVMSSISDITQQVDKLVSSIFIEGLSKQVQGRRGPRHNQGYHDATKTNCVDINGSNVEGMTVNNGATNCSGAVIHRTVLPPRSPQVVSQF